MTITNNTPANNLKPAVKAIGELFEHGFDDLNRLGSSVGVMAHSEIGRASIDHKMSAFYRHFLPLRKDMVTLLADSYRRYFRLGLAHLSRAYGEADGWAQGQLWPAVCLVMNWQRDWYILACDGENQSLRLVGSMNFVPNQTVSLSIPATLPPSPPPASWRAPSWLFGVSVALTGIALLKERHVPAKDSEERLGEAHTRLLLKGSRRVFFRELGSAIIRVRNEEVAAAGAIPAEAAGEPSKGKDSKEGPKGIEGLVRKSDLSQYINNLTEKQRLAFSLKYEYELGLADIASRMGLDRKTVYEHIEAANRKINQDRSNEKSRGNRSKSTDE